MPQDHFVLVQLHQLEQSIKLGLEAYGIFVYLQKTQKFPLVLKVLT